MEQTPHREIWRFGVPGEPIYDCLVKFLKLRYRLLPYIYSLAGQVTQADYTIYRLLSFDFREDPNTFDIRDQFMFGPSFLVSPVIQPMYYGPNSTPLPPSEETRSVYLPAGGDWFDFWTDQYYSGGQTIIANASIDTMPLFVRSGSIVPLGPDIQYTEQAVDAALVLKIIIQAAMVILRCMKMKLTTTTMKKVLFPPLKLTGWKNRAASFLENARIFSGNEGNPETGYRFGRQASGVRRSLFDRL